MEINDLSFMSEEKENGEQVEVVTPEENVDQEAEVGQSAKEQDSSGDMADLRDQLKRDLEEIGSLKRDLKDAIKSARTGTGAEKSTPEKKPEENLIEKTFLRAADVVDPDEVELALETSKKWNMPVDQLVDDEDWKVKLDKLRTQKANETATSKVKGSGQTSNAKSTPEYWLAKGVYPTAEQVPNRKDRVKIAQAFITNEKEGKKFYND